MLRRALVAGLGAVRREWAESGAAAHGVRRLLPLAADQRDRARRAWSATCTGRTGTAGAVWSGSGASASSCRSPWSGRVLLPGGWRWVGLAVLGVAAVVGGAVVVLSALAVSGHLVIFLVAAESVGVALTPLQLLPIGALVLLGAAIPLNVAGWGPREGVAVWAFAAFGSTAAVGLTVSVTFGVLATVATLPGLVLVGGAPCADRPYTLLSLRHVARRLPRRRQRPTAPAVQRRRLRPGRRDPGGQRRDPGRCRDRPQRRPAAAGPLPRAGRATAGRGAAGPAAQGDRDQPRQARPGRAVLHRRHRAQARLLRQRHRGHGHRAPVVGRHRRRRRSPASSCAGSARTCTRAAYGG